MVVALSNQPRNVIKYNIHYTCYSYFVPAHARPAHDRRPLVTAAAAAVFAACGDGDNSAR
jgi:hypothetical protein